MNKDLVQIGDCTLQEAMNKLDRAGHGVLFIVDEQEKMLGMLTDGDIRRAIIKKQGIDFTIFEAMNREFHYWTLDQDRENGYRYLKKNMLRHLPVLGMGKKLVDILILDVIEQQDFKNPVVLMVGGLGTRLGALTKSAPKPMLEIGNKPILETIINKFAESGFCNFYFAVNYKGEKIEEYFGNGLKWGVNIQYLKEEKQLGTAGALSLIREKQKYPLIVMNGDVLTKLDFGKIIQFHDEQEAVATMCIREYDFQIPYGVVKLDNHKISQIEEKPTQKFFVNAGIYVISPSVLKFIPKNLYFDMPQLFQKLIDDKFETTAFPINEYWIDIGKIEDFNQANGDYADVFDK